MTETTGTLRISGTEHILQVLGAEYKTNARAINEFFQNAIEARAKIITATANRTGKQFLSFVDNGYGIPYSHLLKLPEIIGDSIKRHAEEWDEWKRTVGIKGENGLTQRETTGFHGIGLPTAASFLGATVVLIRTRAGGSSTTYELEMSLIGDTSYTIRESQYPLSEKGTAIILYGIGTKRMRSIGKLFTQRNATCKLGEYLTSAFGRDIANDKFRLFVKNVNTLGSKQSEVRPLSFTGIHIKITTIQTPSGPVEFNLYIKVPSSTEGTGIWHIAGPVVMDIVDELRDFRKMPWTQIEGIVTAPFLHRTSAGISTRNKEYQHFRDAMNEAGVILLEYLKRDAEERLSVDDARNLRRVFKEIFRNPRMDRLDLPKLMKSLAISSGDEEAKVQLASRSNLEGSTAAGRGRKPFATPAKNPLDKSKATKPGPVNRPVHTTRIGALQWKTGPFGPEKTRLRYELRSGVIFINTTHPDYLLFIEEIEGTTRKMQKIHWIVIITCMILVGINMPDGEHTSVDRNFYQSILVHQVMSRIK